MNSIYARCWSFIPHSLQLQFLLVHYITGQAHEIYPSYVPAHFSWYNVKSCAPVCLFRSLLESNLTLVFIIKLEVKRETFSVCQLNFCSCQWLLAFSVDKSTISKLTCQLFHTLRQLNWWYLSTGCAMELNWLLCISYILPSSLVLFGEKRGKQNWIIHIGNGICLTLDWPVRHQSLKQQQHVGFPVSLCFPVSISKCWDGSQDSKLPLHASHVALPT